jgi:hypothetical protein
LSAVSASSSVLFSLSHILSDQGSWVIILIYPGITMVTTKGRRMEFSLGIGRRNSEEGCCIIRRINGIL